MKEKIDKLVNKVRENFSVINKTLKEIEDTFVFKDFEDVNCSSVAKIF